MLLGRILDANPHFFVDFEQLDVHREGYWSNSKNDHEEVLE